MLTLHSAEELRRFFTIPIENAKDLADALRDAGAGWTSEKPDWLVARELATKAQEELVPAQR